MSVIAPMPGETIGETSGEGMPMVAPNCIGEIMLTARDMLIDAAGSCESAAFEFCAARKELEGMATTTLRSGPSSLVRASSDELKRDEAEVDCGLGEVELHVAEPADAGVPMERSDLAATAGDGSADRQSATTGVGDVAEVEVDTERPGISCGELMGE